MYSKRKYIEGFRRWLTLMNYEETSIKYGPDKLMIFLDWMDENEVEKLEAITGSKVKKFFEELGERKSKATGRILSLATLRTYLTTINRFARYLRQSGEGNIEVPVKFKGQADKKIVVLSSEEIEKLYDATEDSLLGIRDRAMLAVIYGCGVRRNEAEHIEVKDVLPDRNLLYISKGKGGKERYVPIVGKVKKEILEYLQIARPMMLEKQVHQRFFVGISGKPLKGPSLYGRIKNLSKKAEIDKSVGLHTLRHSIATHLLINGMKLTQIAKFLGHSSLESTQIYTHLSEEVLLKEKQESNAL